MLHAPRRTRRATLSIFTVLAMLALALSSAAALLPSRGSAQVPPPPPVITSPISGALVGASFLVTGTGVPNTLLTIKVIRSGGVVHNTYSLTVPADGAWSLTISSPNLVLLAGFDVQASQNAPTELLSNMVHLTNSAPPPTITSPVTGATVPGGALVVSGTGVAGLAGTQVLVSSPTLGSQGAVSVLADGTWTKTFTLPNPIPVAGIDLSAKQRVLPGAYSADSNVVHVGPVVVQCLAGTYSATGNAPCTSATAGFYVPSAGATVQIACPAGQTSATGATACVPIPPPAAPVLFEPIANAAVNERFGVVVLGSPPNAVVTLRISVAGITFATHTLTSAIGFNMYVNSPLPFSQTGFDLSATQTIPGNLSVSPATVVHLTNLPPPPVITSPVNGKVVGETFLVSGTGLAGGEISITAAGMPTQYTPIGSDGRWEITLFSSPDRPTGGFDVYAYQRASFTPPQYNYSERSNVVHLSNYAPPPTITSPADGATVSGAFVVSGLGVPGYSVSISTDGQWFPGYSTVVPANGVWAITLSPPSTSGGFHLSALQLSPVYGSLWGTSPAIHLFAAEPAPLCAAGTYGEYGREPCTAASPGHFVGGNGRTTQDACNFGTYQPQEGQASCLPAPAGSYVWTTGATSAALCGVGTFQNLTGQNYCGPAPAGSYVDTIGAATATLCPAGTYSPEFVDLNSRVGAITCTPAPAGAYIPNPGSTAYYHLCAAGTYSTGGAAACTPAPVDTYVPDYAGVAAIACPAGTGTNGLTGQTACTPIVIVIAPPFSLPGSLPDAAACLCLPPYMVQDPFTTHHWWARAGGGGALLIEPFAIGVNPAETGTLTVKVYDPSNVLVGTSTGAHPAGGESPLPPVTVGAPVPGGLYHVTIQVAGGAPQARHYRLELHGATLLGMNSPSQAQPEHDPARWIVNVVAGEPIDVRVDTGVEAGATAAVVNLYSPSGVLIATGGLGVALGTGPAAIGGQWVVEVITGPGLSVGHYLITRNSGSDRGIYVDWLTFGHGALTVSLIRNGVPNALPVTVDVVDVLTNAVVATQVGVLGAANFTDLPVGNYRVRITGPDNVSVDTFVTCDGVTPITITLPNRPPKAVADTATTPEDTAVTIPVLTNDSDSDGGTLSVASATQGAHGSVAVNGDGTVTYTPAPNWNGTDTFTYTVSDGQGGTATATVAVTVTPVNDQPVAVDDSATTPEDTAVTVSVLGNDSDVDGDTLTVTSVTQGANGTVAIVGSQAVYTPASNWSGTDTFTYTIVDGNGGTGTATVTVTVTSVNDPPAAANDTATTPEDTAVTILVLTNDSDSDGGTLSVASAAQGAHGSVVVNGDGTVTYTPASNWNGADTFSYTIDDGQGGTATATVTVTVTPVNDQPVAVGDSATTPEDTAVTTNVTSNDSDVDGDTLSVTGVTQGANGTVAIVGNQAIYTPASNWSGTDTFTYTIVDGHGGTATATVTVTVTPVNDLPTAVNDSATTNAVTAIAIPVLANDSDGDGGTLSVVSASTPANGAVVVNPSGTVTYTSTAAFSGTDTFTYTVSDGQGGTATATVTVTVKASAGPGCSDKPKDGKSDDDHQSKDGKKGGRESTEDRDRDCPRSEPRMTGGGTIEQPGSQGSQSKDDDKSKGSQSKDDGKSKGGQSSANCQSKDDGKSKGGQSSTDCKSKDDGKSKGSQSSNDDDKSKSGQSKDENKSKRWTWGFEIRCDGSKANLEYQDHTGGNFHLESVTSVVCTDDPAVNPTPPQAGFDTLHLIGVGRWNGVSGHTVDVTFVDAGEPGTRDSIVLTVKTAGGAVVSTVSGKLSGGNHQAHK